MTTKKTKVTWTVERVTGKVTPDGLHESDGHVYSKHRTREAAEKALAKLRDVAPLVNRHIFERQDNA